MKREHFRDIKQNEPEWLQLRSGLITASTYAALLAEGEGKMYDALIHRVAGEIITGTPDESYTNSYMERGHQQEPAARAEYAMRCRCDPEQIGFIRLDHEGPRRTGCSPDALIGDDGLLQIKTQKADLLIKTIFRASFPPEHKPQVQGELYVSGRKWADLMIYCPRMPPFIIRSTRDEPYIKRIEAKLQQANADIDTIVKRIRARM